MELSKQRSKREIDADTYNRDSGSVMAKLDGLFAARDKLSEQQNMATLSETYKEIVAEFLQQAETQNEFDKDIFTQLVDKIVVKSRERVIYVLKDGTEIEGITETAE